MGEGLRALAITLAALGAVAMAFGAQFQNDAVVKRAPSSEGKGSLSFKQLISLIARPKWLSGTAFMGLAILLQIGALGLAPLIVVQPIGAIALVITSLLNARATKAKISKATMVAIALCSAGIAAFVVMATVVAKEIELTDDRLREVLITLAVILAVFGALFLIFGKRLNALTYILGAGTLYGFVATLAKVVIQRIYQGDFEWLTLLCVGGLLTAVALGGWFVQNAYASGPPDLVIAGLTVIDPLVAVSIGIVILGEAQQANLGTMIGFGLSAVVAVAGVYLLSKVHPELRSAR